MYLLHKELTTCISKTVDNFAWNGLVETNLRMIKCAKEARRELYNFFKVKEVKRTQQ